MADDMEFDGDLDDADESKEPTAKELEDLEDVVDPDDAPTENKWASRRSLSEMLEEADEAAKGTPGKKAATPTAKKGEELEGDDDADLDDEDLDEDDAGEEEDAPKRDAKADQAKPTEGAAKARYSVKAADGKAFEFELQPGTSIQFKADGRDVEVKTVDELVQLAQKGVAFDRKTSEQGQAIQRQTATIGTLQEQIATTRQTAEQTLMAALFDRDARQRLRVALAPYRDPEFRKGIEAQQTLAQQNQEREEQHSTELEAKRTEFWQGVGNEIRKEIAKTDSLTASDAIEVATRFHAGYTQLAQAKYAELRAAGVDDAKAQADANAHALSTHFTEKNLRRVVRGLNAELADERRATARKGGTQRSAGTAKAGAAEAEAHNRKLAARQEQRKRTPRLQGGGALPGGSSRSGSERGSAPAKALTFSQRMERATSMLRNGDD